jgi:hypothetical protein
LVSKKPVLFRILSSLTFNNTASGDFVAGIALAKDCRAALKQNGGASSDYQGMVEDLEKVQEILAHVQKLKTDEHCLQLGNDIRGQAQDVQRKVQQFMKDTEKYKSALGTQAPKGFYRGSFTKIKWAQHASIKAKAFRQDVTTQMNSIQILLDLLSRNEEMQHDASVRTALTKITDCIVRASGDIKDLPDKIKDGLEPVPAQISKSFQSLHETYSTTSTGLGDRICSDTQQSFGKVAALVASSGQAELAVSLRIHEEMATAKDVEELKQLLNSHLRRQETNTNPPKPSESRTQFTFILAISQINLPSQLVKALLSRLRAKVEAFGRFSIATLLTSLKQIVLVVPQLMQISRVMNSLPPAVSLVLHDNLRLTDALGRFHSLQFQQNRHWRVFETTLKCSFENLPGQQKVATGQFILTSSKYPGQTLDERNWSDYARPGLDIAMSISLKTVLAKKGHCPRGCGSQTTIVSHTDSECRRCGLIFSARHPKLTRATTPHDSNNQAKSSSDDTSTIAKKPHKPSCAFKPRRRERLVARKGAEMQERKELEMLKRVHLLIYRKKTPVLRNTSKPEHPQKAFDEMIEQYNQHLQEFPDICISAYSSLGSEEKFFKGKVDTETKVNLISEHTVADRWGTEQIDATKACVLTDFGVCDIATMGQIRLKLRFSPGVKLMEAPFQVIPTSVVRYRFDALLSDSLIKRMSILQLMVW